MWNNLACLACLSAIFPLGASGQAPDAKPAKQAGKTAEKPAGKPASNAANKSAEGGPKFGVPTEAEKLLDEAVAKIESLKQFRADVRQSTEMLGYRFVADGQYAIGLDFRMLFELKVQLSDTTGSLKEACDGRTYWRYQQVLDTQELTRMDIKKIREVIEKDQFNQDVRDKLINQLGFSGIVPLMKGLRESQKFESFEEDKLGEAPVYVLDGRWREEAINQASFRGQQLSLANWPGYLPSKCKLWIGKEDGWPHRVRLESAKKVQGSTTVITLEFLNPMIGVDLPESLFVFEPPAGIKLLDQTDIMVQNLNSMLQQMQGGGDKQGRSPLGLSPTTPTNPGDRPKSKAPAPGSEAVPKQLLPQP